MKRAIRRAALIILVGRFLAGFEPFLGNVLCIGDDGHLAFEPGTVICCELSSGEPGSANRRSAQAALDSPHPEHCGSCLDIVIAPHGSDFYRFPPPSSSSNLVRIPASLTALFASTAAERASPFLLETREAAIPTLPSIRSVILLI